MTKDHMTGDPSIPEMEFKNVVSLFRAVSRSFPSKPAIVAPDKTLTYKELDQQSDALAAHLVKLGLSGGVIAVCMKQSAERIVSFLAVLKAGAGYIPVDGQLPESRIKLMLEDSGTRLILTEDLYLNRFPERAIDLISMDQWSSPPDAADATALIDPDEISPMQTAYIIYTSGSTGIPKGVGIHHEAFYTFVAAFIELWGFSSEGRTLQFGSPGFDVSIIDMWIPLFTGATMILYPDNKIVGQPLLDFIIDQDIDVLPYLPPAVLSTLPSNVPIGRLHTIFLAGEAASEQSVKNWYKRVRLINVYGPTETTVAVAGHCFQEDTDPHIIGKPLSSADVYIMDADLQQVKDGLTGEIYIGGRQLAKGYINRPVETAKVFIEAPVWLKSVHGDEYLLYKSGDRAFRREDGNISFVGRMDDQVKIRGFRIELKEVEHHIGQLPQVANAAVKVHRPEEGLPVLAAFLELKPNGRERMTTDDIRARLKQSLPVYMVPEKIIFYDKLPLTLTGKIDKNKLHVPLQRAVKKARERVDAPDLKQEMQEIWMDLLGLEEVNENDNFFELGGHSLMLAQMHERLPLNVQKKIRLTELYTFPTIRLFVKEVETRLMQDEATQQEKALQVQELLQRDAVLPFDFEITVQPDPQILANPSRIFLTGVTGFVGSHLLEELIPKNPDAVIYCLVRAENEAMGLERIKNTFHKFKLVWQPAYEARIKIVPGDITKRGLGMGEGVYETLQKEIEVIYHMASDVSYVQPYEYIKKPNVDGMANILHLAVHGKTKFLIISSSTGVYSWGRSFTGKTWMTEDDPIEQNLPAVCRDMGYIRSKWVMERMAVKAREKGLALINFRLGFVVCHGETGATPLNQWWSSLMRSCIDLKAFPLVMGLKDEVVTVDYVCKAITHISKKPDAIGLNFNLNPLPEHDLSLTDFCVRITDYCGLEMKGMDFREWFAQWKRNQELPIYALLYLFTEDVHEGKSLVEAYENTYYLKSDNTARFLEDSAIRPAIFNKKVIEAYLRFMKMI